MSAVIVTALCVPEATLMPRVPVLPLMSLPTRVRRMSVPEPGAMLTGLRPVIELKF
jgi:hypothetical protein